MPLPTPSKYVRRKNISELYYANQVHKGQEEMGHRIQDSKTKTP